MIISPWQRGKAGRRVCCEAAGFETATAFQKFVFAPLISSVLISAVVFFFSVTGGELFEDIVAREFYSEVDAR